MHSTFPANSPLQKNIGDKQLPIAYVETTLNHAARPMPLGH